MAWSTAGSLVWSGLVWSGDLAVRLSGSSGSSTPGPSTTEVPTLPIYHRSVGSKTVAVTVT